MIRKGVCNIQSKLVLIFVIFFIHHSFAFSDIYKWADKQGNVHYGNKPASDVKANRVKIDPGPNLSDLDRLELQKRSHGFSPEEIERSNRERQEKIIEQKILEKTKQAQELICNKAIQQLAVLSEMRPVYRSDNGEFRAKWMRDTYEGKRQYIEDDNRSAEIRKAAHKVSITCEKPDDKAKYNLIRNRWIKSEYCASARRELKAAQQSEIRATRDTLESKQRLVDNSCR